MINYAIVAFLRTPELEINLLNFELICHIYYLTICNGFGIADNQLIRIGTGIYHPTVRTLYKNFRT